METNQFEMLVDDSVLTYLGKKLTDEKRIYCIFKVFFLREISTGNCFGRIEAPMWYGVEVKEDKNGNLFVIGELKQFASTEQAFVYFGHEGVKF